MASASKVIVGLVDPILSNRAEDVDRERILEHLDLVLDPTWNLEHVTFAENNLAPIDRELQYAFQDLRNLLALMRMTRHDAAALPVRYFRSIPAVTVSDAISAQCRGVTDALMMRSADLIRTLTVA